MLAFASESESRAEPNPSRTVTVDTLFAEALMQTGRVEEARHWWDYLVDSRGVDRFSTLLRCAEAETAVGSDLLLAEQRITAARVAARNERYRISLVDLLDAELSVRRLQFDSARALLESVIRSSETDSGVRGRAQWLIGETHYLQRKFHEAIEAYRRVEGIDPHGQWVSASLLQAGKSFEQLGRTREAAVCYGNLLSRFSDASHAALARRRLAAIAPDTNPSNDNSSQRTIRR
jgi:tetratricopeptide (TPR) repeat protein